MNDITPDPEPLPFVEITVAFEELRRTIHVDWIGSIEEQGRQNKRYATIIRHKTVASRKWMVLESYDEVIARVRAAETRRNERQRPQTPNPDPGPLITEDAHDDKR